ncbi:MAG: AIM24 family protein, partial [Phycisphaerales bacterium]
MRSHLVDYQIHGDDLQFVEITLDPGETVIAEAGAMMFKNPAIGMATRMGDGSSPNSGFLGSLLGAGKRMLAGEGLFMTHFTHGGAGRATVAFGAPYPGKIVAVALAQVGGRFLC